ncbi:tripartite motif-containing protein 2-like [Lingula anatina]|uniref:Tripartite motif-containing protein 2-like n=1 Tax=Lingula anatina TaxID=7574 RepID=A0A1S3KH36_LINAN|nr:tripartite motif-containing protein 2-like [Lingula anatina]|eukprot:XP_013421546.1 tripartite motif-containing protein 2-like [Lingula anatina]
MATASMGDEDGSLRAKILENFTNCSICLKDFEDPTVLPCLHTYCKRCLASYIPEKTPGSIFLCPLCQKETKLPKDGVEGFPHNYFIDSLQDTVLTPTRKKKCGACAVEGEDIEAVSKCLNCSEYLCGPCAKSHIRFKMLINHKVYTFEQLRSGEHHQEVQEFQCVFCPEHKEEPIRYFCLKCQIPICRDCKVLTHDEHKCTSLDTAIETVKPKLASMLEKLDDKISIQENELTILQAVLRDHDTNTSSVMKDISDHSRHLQQQIQQQEMKLLQEVQQVSEAHRKNITLYLENCEVTTSTMKSTSDLVGSILSRGTPAEILILQQQVGDRLQELLLPSGGGDIPQHLSLQLQTNNDVDREVNKGTGLGKIQQDRQAIQGINSRGPLTVTQKAQIKEKPHLVSQFDSNCSRPYSLTTPAKPQQGYLVVDYYNNKVCRFNLDGQLIVEQFKAGNRSLGSPFGVAVLPDGTIVVSEYNNNKLIFMSQDLTLTKEIDMKRPVDLHSTNFNTILVAQPDLTQISIVNTHGVTVDTIKHSSFQWPWCVTVLNNGNIVVSDMNAKAVFILSPTGSLLHTYTGSGQNKLCCPCGVCVDQYDNIMVADHSTNKIHIISIDGKFVQFLATEDDGLQVPFGLTINHDGDIAVSQDEGEIKVFRYMDSE